MEKKRKNMMINQLIGFAITMVLIIVVNIIGNYVFKRFDLTSEKRYTLSETTINTLKGLDDYVHFKVYLEGEFPAGFKKLRRETKEMLDEFRAYSKYISYEFINPSESSSISERNETYKILYQSGLNPTELSVDSKEGKTQMVIWPGALVSYRNDTELPIELLEDQKMRSAEETLNVSMQNLEYKLIDGVIRVTQAEKRTVAFIEGHGELTQREVQDITQTLQKNYDVHRLEIDGKVNALLRRSEVVNDEPSKIYTNYDAIIIAKPTLPFSEKDKFLIDQYIMHGGKVLWLIDPIVASMDSLQYSESTMGVELDLNLDDMLFKYGLKINKNLLLDLNCALIPVRSGQVAGQAQLEYFRWFYFPLLQSASNHPMVRNLNPIKGDFVSSIEATTSNMGINQIPLLKTSNYTKISGSPVFITLSMLKQTPDQRMFSQRSQNVAYLLKGTFPSLYANRITQDIMSDKDLGFLEESSPTAMIVIADGDMIRNQFGIPRGEVLPLGYDQFTNNTYGNKEFLLNAISYLVDGEGLINIRSRELKIRLLNATRINKERVLWQVVNTLVPVSIVLIFGLIFSIIRKRRYGIKNKQKLKARNK